MGAALFYHLTRAPLERALPVLLERALAQGWRVAVRGRTDAFLAKLDDALWEWPEDGFLPHGMDGTGREAAQPVLLTLGPAPGRECLMAVEGAEVSPEEVRGAARICILFDGRDPAAVEAARGQWRALTTAGCAAQYWSQEGGRWEMRREAAGGGAGAA